jgi:hypothetical protein
VMMQDANVHVQAIDLVDAFIGRGMAMTSA